MNWIKIKRAITALAFAGIPLATTVSCEPLGGVTVFREDDDYYDFVVEETVIYDDCGFFDDCYYDEIIIIED